MKKELNQQKYGFGSLIDLISVAAIFSKILSISKTNRSSLFKRALQINTYS